MYESKDEAPLSSTAFAWRMVKHFLMVVVLIAIVIAIGVAGHVFFEDVPLHDALLNTTMLLGGLGVSSHPTTVGGKLFMSFYGFVTGLSFVATISILLAPIFHRVMHNFHLDEE